MVLDYKSNVLKRQTSFAADDLYVEMGLSGYPLQALLYCVALHRYLRSRNTRYDPQRHLGGATYYYVRGAAIAPASTLDGVAHWDLPASVIVAASDLLNGANRP